jgi:hypothetical protein
MITDGREMIFDIPKTIAYLSAGTTLEAGSLIMVHHIVAGMANYLDRNWPGDWHIPQAPSYLERWR